MKKVLIDVSFLFDQNSKRGLGIYGRNLLKKLLEYILSSGEAEVGLLGFKNLKSNLVEIGYTEFEIEELNKLGMISFISIGKPNPARNSFREWQKLFLPALKQYQPDLYFTLNIKRIIPKTNYNVGEVKKNLKVVVSLLDFYAVHEIRKNLYLNPIRQIAQRVNFTRIMGSSACIVPTNKAKAEFQKLTINPTNLVVIPPGVSENYFFNEEFISNEKLEHIKKIYSIQEPYFFFNNSLEDTIARKLLINFLIHLKINNSVVLPKKLLLVGRDFKKGIGKNIVGKTQFGQNFLDLAKKYKLMDFLIATDRVPEEHYVALIAGSKISLPLANDEKFNMILLQSMASYKPVIVKGTHIDNDLTEGSAAGYIDFDSAVSNKNSGPYWQEFFATLHTAINDQQKIEANLDKAYQIAKKYNWNATAGKTWNLFKDLLDLKGNEEFDN